MTNQVWLDSVHCYYFKYIASMSFRNVIEMSIEKYQITILLMEFKLERMERDFYYPENKKKNPQTLVQNEFLYS